MATTTIESHRAGRGEEVRVSLALVESFKPSMSVSEAMLALGCGRQALHRLIDSGELGSRRVPGSRGILLRTAEVLYLAERYTIAATAASTKGRELVAS